MNKYNNSKIYTIRSHQTDKFYIGSTIKKYLSDRLSEHKSSFKKNINITSSFEILQFEDAYIELLENVNCNDRNELCKREGELIRQYKNQCVNINISGRCREDYKKDNRQLLNEKQKKYNLENKEIIANKRKEKILCFLCGVLISDNNIARHEKIKHQDII